MNRILIVDDNSKNIQILGNLFIEQGYEAEYVLNGQEAVDLVKNEDFDLILMDVMMPVLDGFSACKKIKEMKSKADIPIIFSTAKTDNESIKTGFSIGGVDYITKPFENSEVIARVKTHLALADARRKLQNQNKILDEQVNERTKEIALTQEATILSLATLAETRDDDTGNHIVRTQNYMHILSIELMKDPQYSHILTPKLIRLFKKTSPLHDMGKVGIPDAILQKPGKLTDNEFTLMQTHTELGYKALKKAERVLGENSFLSVAAEIAYTHHEKWDGTGYPRRLAGEDIPLSGRIMAIADVYDALVSKRAYKPPFSHKKAMDIITEGKGSHFCPDMVDAFVRKSDDFLKVAQDYSDSEYEKNALLE